MSDFDREAEREKLREKYERDKEKREASERMSELLLQGATMTNRHCPACHSPVFRYDGREFCPTCEKEVSEEGELLDADGERVSSEDEGAGVEAETEMGKNDSERAVDEQGESSKEPDHRSEQAAESAPTPARDTRPARIDPPARQDTGAHDGGSDHTGESDTRGETLRNTEVTLMHEIGSLTQQAAETRDIGRKRNLLAAAREAAETLESVRRL